MKKGIWFKWLLAIIFVCSVFALAVLIVIPQKTIYCWLYEQQELEAQSGISEFEAELNYDGLLQQIMGNQEIHENLTYDSEPQLQRILEYLNQIYYICKWTAGIGIVISIVGMLLLRKQKWYECLKLSGILTLILDAVLVLVTYTIAPLRNILWNSQYELLLGEDATLSRILPDYWACYTELAGVAVICIAGLLMLAAYGISRKSYRPHKF